MAMNWTGSNTTAVVTGAAGAAGAAGARSGGRDDAPVLDDDLLPPTPVPLNQSSAAIANSIRASIISAPVSTQMIDTDSIVREFHATSSPSDRGSHNISILKRAVLNCCTLPVKDIHSVFAAACSVPEARRHPLYRAELLKFARQICINRNSFAGSLSSSIASAASDAISSGLSAVVAAATDPDWIRICHDASRLVADIHEPHLLQTSIVVMRGIVRDGAAVVDLDGGDMVTRALIALLWRAGGRHYDLPADVVEHGVAASQSSVSGARSSADSQRSTATQQTSTSSITTAVTGAITDSVTMSNGIFKLIHDVICRNTADYTRLSRGAKLLDAIARFSLQVGRHKRNLPSSSHSDGYEQVLDDSHAIIVADIVKQLLIDDPIDAPYHAMANAICFAGEHTSRITAHVHQQLTAEQRRSLSVWLWKMLLILVSLVPDHQEYIDSEDPEVSRISDIVASTSQLLAKFEPLWRGAVFAIQHISACITGWLDVSFIDREMTRYLHAQNDPRLVQAPEKIVGPDSIVLHALANAALYRDSRLAAAAITNIAAVLKRSLDQMPFHGWHSVHVVLHIFARRMSNERQAQPSSTSTVSTSASASASEKQQHQQLSAAQASDNGSDGDSDSGNTLPSMFTPGVVSALHVLVRQLADMYDEGQIRFLAGRMINSLFDLRSVLPARGFQVILKHYKTELYILPPLDGWYDRIKTLVTALFDRPPTAESAQTCLELAVQVVGTFKAHEPNGVPELWSDMLPILLRYMQQLDARADPIYATLAEIVCSGFQYVEPGPFPELFSTVVAHYVSALRSMHSNGHANSALEHELNLALCRALLCAQNDRRPPAASAFRSTLELLTSLYPTVSTDHRGNVSVEKGSIPSSSYLMFTLLMLCMRADLHGRIYFVPLPASVSDISHMSGAALFAQSAAVAACIKTVNDLVATKVSQPNPFILCTGILGGDSDNDSNKNDGDSNNRYSDRTAPPFSDCTVVGIACYLKALWAVVSDEVDPQFLLVVLSNFEQQIINTTLWIDCSLDVWNTVLYVVSFLSRYVDRSYPENQATITTAMFGERRLNDPLFLVILQLMGTFITAGAPLFATDQADPRRISECVRVAYTRPGTEARRAAVNASAVALLLISSDNKSLLTTTLDFIKAFISNDSKLALAILQFLVLIGQQTEFVQSMHSVLDKIFAVPIDYIDLMTKKIRQEQQNLDMKKIKEAEAKAAATTTATATPTTTPTTAPAAVTTPTATTAGTVTVTATTTSSKPAKHDKPKSSNFLTSLFGFKSKDTPAEESPRQTPPQQHQEKQTPPLPQQQQQQKQQTKQQSTPKTPASSLPAESDAPKQTIREMSIEYAVEAEFPMVVAYMAIYTWFAALSPEQRQKRGPQIISDLLKRHTAPSQITDADIVCIDFIQRMMHQGAVKEEPFHSGLTKRRLAFFGVKSAATQPEMLYYERKIGTTTSHWINGFAIVSCRVSKDTPWGELIVNRPSFGCCYPFHRSNMALLDQFAQNLTPTLNSSDLVLPINALQQPDDKSKNDSNDSNNNSGNSAISHRMPTPEMTTVTSSFSAPLSAIVSHGAVPEMKAPARAHSIKRSSQQPLASTQSPSNTASPSVPSSSLVPAELSPAAWPFIALTHPLIAASAGSFVPIGEPETKANAVSKALSDLDCVFPIDVHNIGVIYCAPGQQIEGSKMPFYENDSGSGIYNTFVKALGKPYSLRDPPPPFGEGFYPDGSDGETSIYWRDELSLLLFRVTTMIPAPAERRMLQIQRRTQLAGNAHVGIYWNETGKPIELPKGPNAAQFVGIIITPVGQSHPRLEQQMPSTAVSQMETAREYRQMLLDNCIRRIPTATAIAAAATAATSAGSPSDGDKWIFQPVPPHLLFYVHVVFSLDFPHIGPCLEPRLVSLFDLAPFVRTVAVQANMFALRFAHVIVNQRFVDGIKRTTSSAARESTRYDFPWRKRLQSIHALRKQAGIDGFGSVGTGPSAATAASSVAAAAAVGGKSDSDNKDAKAQPLQSQMEAVINTARLGHPAKAT